VTVSFPYASVSTVRRARARVQASLAMVWACGILGLHTATIRGARRALGNPVIAMMLEHDRLLWSKGIWVWWARGLDRFLCMCGCRTYASIGDGAISRVPRRSSSRLWGASRTSELLRPVCLWLFVASVVPWHLLSLFRASFYCPRVLSSPVWRPTCVRKFWVSLRLTIDCAALMTS